MSISPRLLAAAMFFLPCLEGCGATLGDCLSIGTFALSVTVTDSRNATSQLVGATVVFQFGAARDTVTVPASHTAPFLVHGYQPGTHTVTVSKPGYVTSSQVVQVFEGECGRAQTVDVKILLVPAG